MAEKKCLELEHINMRSQGRRYGLTPCTATEPNRRSCVEDPKVESPLGCLVCASVAVPNNKHGTQGTQWLIGASLGFSGRGCKMRNMRYGILFL